MIINVFTYVSGNVQVDQMPCYRRGSGVNYGVGSGLYSMNGHGVGYGVGHGKGDGSVYGWGHAYGTGDGNGRSP
jgi:hypothetical protein